MMQKLEADLLSFVNLPQDPQFSDTASLPAFTTRLEIPLLWSQSLPDKTFNTDDAMVNPNAIVNKM